MTLSFKDNVCAEDDTGKKAAITAARTVVAGAQRFFIVNTPEKSEIGQSSADAGAVPELVCILVESEFGGHYELLKNCLAWSGPELIIALFDFWCG
jgi:hypothetical protein